MRGVSFTMFTYLFLLTSYTLLNRISHVYLKKIGIKKTSDWIDYMLLLRIRDRNFFFTILRCADYLKADINGMSWSVFFIIACDADHDTHFWIEKLLYCHSRKVRRNMFFCGKFGGDQFIIYQAVIY